MLKSMTGYGRAVISNATCDLRAELKCVNSKYCDINVRLPKILSLSEIPLRAFIQEKLIRGKVDVNVEAKFHKPVQAPALNRQTFISALNVLEQMKTMGGLNDDITLDHLLRFNDLIEYDANSELDELEAALKSALAGCIKEADAMRAEEGNNLKSKIIQMLDKMDTLSAQVDNFKNDFLLYWADRLKTRMNEFLHENVHSQDRIIQEAAIYTEKANIKEELARLYSHQQQFRKIMDTEFPCGKKLDFLCQEMYREWNTVAAKSPKIEIINIVVEAKTMVDSIREQIQNVI
ncbi:MAG: YicC family protein [Deferribacteraceae bacterium]|jgi:uncharacterized protein (TIGR00255 family)|nr:YicC family protein [Deferribacteraceae bacterium]